MPQALVLSRYMGEHRLLVAGEVLDQPAGLYFAARKAGYIAYLLEEQAKPDFVLTQASWLSADDVKTLLELNELRKKMTTQRRR